MQILRYFIPLSSVSICQSLFSLFANLEDAVNYDWPLAEYKVKMSLSSKKFNKQKKT